MTRAITCTTRAPRPGEKDGVDYYFFSAADFQRRVAAGEFHRARDGVWPELRHFEIRIAGQTAFGPGRFAERGRAGRGDHPRAAQTEPELKRALVSVFLTPPSIAVLEARLKNRAADSAAEIQNRLAVARREIAQWNHFDYLLISASVPEDLRRMLAIVEAEKMRVARSEAPEF